MKNIYIVKIDEKYFNKIIKYHIYILNIKKRKHYYLLYLDFNNYEKLLKFKKIYNIELVGYKGLIKYKKVLKKYYLFFIIFLISIFYLVFLSNIVFFIEVKTTDKEIEKLVLNELKNEGISVFNFIKSFQEKEEIRDIILNNNKDKLEWIEINRVGSGYEVYVEKRIINKIDDDTTPRNIVALKNAIILSIDARTGSIVKKLNDYVKAGDVIVSGEIVHNEKVVDMVPADAVIYGETWYNVHVSYPISYYEKTYTGNTKKRLSITFFNKKFNFFDKNKYKEEEIVETKLLYHKFLPFKISIENSSEVILIDDLYTTDEAVLKAIEVAREKLLKTLPSNSKILQEKKLKIVVNNSTIDVDVFFKVYENITDIEEIVIEENKKLEG